MSNQNSDQQPTIYAPANEGLSLADLGPGDNVSVTRPDGRTILRSADQVLTSEHIPVDHAADGSHDMLGGGYRVIKLGGEIIDFSQNAPK